MEETIKSTDNDGGGGKLKKEVAVVNSIKKMLSRN
jgi:hypothetical protein